MSLPEQLQSLLNQDGFIIFIEGKKGSGKTNLAMLLNEVCFQFKYRKAFATNIFSECYYISKIINYYELKEWLENKKLGKKTYTLDEAGKIIKRMRFMSESNILFMDLLQLIRHYDCGFIGIAPSSKFIDSNFLNTDILDARIVKLSLTNAKIYDYTNNDVYYWNNLPKTSIIHNSKDIASFNMERRTVTSELPLCCQVASFYANTGSYQQVMLKFKIQNRESVRFQIIKHLKHSSKELSVTHEVAQSLENVDSA